MVISRAHSAGMDVAARRQGYSSNIYSPHYQVGWRCHSVSCSSARSLPASSGTALLHSLCFLFLCSLHGSMILASVVAGCKRECALKVFDPHGEHLKSTGLIEQTLKLCVMSLH